MIQNISLFQIRKGKTEWCCGVPEYIPGNVQVELNRDTETGWSYVVIKADKKTTEAFRNFDTARLYYMQVIMRNIR